MNNKLSLLFDFLQKNSDYNRRVRKVEYEKALLGCEAVEDKIRSLSVFVFNTQAFPKLDLLLPFVKSIKAITTMKGFLEQLIENVPHLKETEVCNSAGKPAKVNYDNLFKALVHQKGWGEKTAALFCKIIYDIHANHSHLTFWEDAPQTLADKDVLYLPVDEVIKQVFNEIEPYNWDFAGVNREIARDWSGKDLLLWDDLWFWGFITQKIKHSQRITDYNEAKFITLQGIATKDFEKTRAKAMEFIEILKQYND